MPKKVIDHGGTRTGAGRKKAVKKGASISLYVPAEVADAASVLGCDPKEVVLSLLSKWATDMAPTLALIKQRKQGSGT